MNILACESSVCDKYLSLADWGALVASWSMYREVPSGNAIASLVKGLTKILLDTVPNRSSTVLHISIRREYYIV
jgi:hypothetical protein